MDERCEKFYEDSLKGINIKEINRFTEFLFNN